ncbi:hypothetical protein AO265_24205 [Pseudomonas sp. ABAC61]|nr:hypothetical protein AO265_24205 [Pseudomonas sp. ABAC61]
MAWGLLLLAAIFEVVFAMGMKYAEGFTLGTVLLGFALLGESLTPVKLISVGLIVVGVVGLKQGS